MIEYLTPPSVPFWQPVYRRVLATVLFFAVLLTSPLFCIAISELRLSQIPSFFDPVLRLCEAATQYWPLSCLEIPAIGVFWIISLSLREWRPVRNLLSVLLLILLIPSFAGMMGAASEPSREALMRQGDAINQEIASYYRAHKKFPPDLNFLADKRLLSSRICARTRWVYERYVEPESTYATLSLEFDEGSHVGSILSAYITSEELEPYWHPSSAVGMDFD